MGATEYQLMSVMGWTKPDMARVYIEKANRGKMASAAIHSLDKGAIQEGEDLVLLRDNKGEYGLVGRRTECERFHVKVTHFFYIQLIQ